MASNIQTRRQFAESLGRFTLVAAGAALTPILSSCSNDSNPASSKEDVKTAAPALIVDLNQAPELKTAGGFKNFQLNATPIVIINSGNNTFKAISLVCTHQACTVAWTAARQDFECPCHGSRYDSNGKVTQGPAASPLQSFTVEYKGAENTILVFA